MLSTRWRWGGVRVSVGGVDFQCQTLQSGTEVKTRFVVHAQGLNTQRTERENQPVLEALLVTRGRVSGLISGAHDSAEVGRR